MAEEAASNASADVAKDVAKDEKPEPEPKMVPPQQKLEGYPDIVITDKVSQNIYSKMELVKCINDFLQDALPLAGWPEDNFWCDVRLCLGCVCGFFALTAQFGTHFPADLSDKPRLLTLIGLFWVFISIITCIDLVIIKSGVICVRAADGQAVFVDVNLPDFSSEVTLGVRTRRTKRQAQRKKSVGEYFDEGGILRQQSVFSDVLALLDEVGAVGTRKKAE